MIGVKRLHANVPAHTAKCIQDFSLENGIHQLYHPPCSPLYHHQKFSLSLNEKTAIWTLFPFRYALG